MIRNSWKYYKDIMNSGQIPHNFDLMGQQLIYKLDKCNIKLNGHILSVDLKTCLYEFLLPKYEEVAEKSLANPLDKIFSNI